MEKWPEEYPDPDKKKKEEQLFFDPDDFKQKKVKKKAKGFIISRLVVLLVVVGICSGLFFATLFAVRFRSPSDETLTLPADITIPGMVFTNDEGLWLTNVEWQAENISSHPEARLSPNGRYLTFLDNGDLFLLDRETNENRKLITEEEQPVCCAQWWPEQPDTILVRTWSNTVGVPSSGLATVTIDGDYQFIDNTSTVTDSPALSPNGTAIAYSKDGQPAIHYERLGIAKLDLVEFGLPTFALVAFPAWSPDGTKLAWITSDNLAGDDGEMNIILLDLVNRTGKILHTFMGNLNSYEWLGIPNSPAFSKNGQWVAFYAVDGVWIVTIDGVDKRFLGEGGNPIWGPIHEHAKLEIAVNKFENSHPVLIFASSRYQIDINSPDFGRLVEWRAMP